MASFNSIAILGYAGKDCEIKYTPQGTAVATFSIATTEKRKGRDGESGETTTWFRVTAFSRLAEIANEYIKKGTQVYLSGRLRQESYTDREGNARTSLEVTANEIQLLGSRERSDSNDEQPARNAAHAAATKAQAPLDNQTKQARVASIAEDEIPFS